MLEESGVIVIGDVVTGRGMEVGLATLDEQVEEGFPEIVFEPDTGRSTLIRRTTVCVGILGILIEACGLPGSQKMEG